MIDKFKLSKDKNDIRADFDAFIYVFSSDRGERALRYLYTKYVDVNLVGKTTEETYLKIGERNVVLDIIKQIKARS